MRTLLPTHMTRLVALLALVALLVGGSAWAQQLPEEDVIDVPAVGDGLCTHNLFQSNMVIQRNKPVRVWGYADPGANVTVSFAGQSASARAGQDRVWSVTLPDALDASSEGRTMTISDGDASLTYDNILVGDVWVLGGQSNMEHPLSRIENGQVEIDSANFPEIRVMSVPRSHGPEARTDFPQLMEWSSWTSQHSRKGYWEICTPENVRELSAIGYVFCRRIHMATQVPIGILDTSRGGSTVETWTPEAALRESDSPHIAAWMEHWDNEVATWDPQADLQRRIAHHASWVQRMDAEGRELTAAQRTPPTELLPGPIADHNRPGACYNGIFNTLQGLPVAGAIFHQGYNNCFNGTDGARMYRDAFPLMIAAWRETLGDPDMPFCILSLCTQGTVQTRDDFAPHMLDAGPFIREAQYQTYLELLESGDENIGFVSTYDLRRTWYHPGLKIPAGERAARWALSTQYGYASQRWEPAMIERVEIEDGTVILHFNAPVAPVADGSPVQGFAIAGADRRFYPADATNLVTGQDHRGRNQYDRNVIVLTSPMVAEPAAYRYAWARSPWANVQNDGNSDIPLPTMRSDDWPMELVPLGVFENDQLPENYHQGHQRQVLHALQQVDLERRRAEARLLLQDQSEDES